MNIAIRLGKYLFTKFVGYVLAENQEPQLQWKVEGPID
jgi:hypothetical protein